MHVGVHLLSVGVLRAACIYVLRVHDASCMSIYIDLW